jgi:dihydroorotate dehydrogenase
MLAARLLPPETAHTLALRALRWGWAGADKTPDDPILTIQAFNRTLKNPIGLAAGFDKDAVALNALGRLGFGFLEAGTSTPLPQKGNPKPRLFRLPADEAVINRMGFNNAGVEVFIKNLRRTDRRKIPAGANIGINKEGADPERDYSQMVTKVAPYADYITINISSPNTPGLRDLQGEAQLTKILATIATNKPVFVKIAPDLAPDGLDAIITVCMANHVTGLIISNTTIARPESLTSPHKSQTGGLSGRPLMEPSTAMLARAYRLAGRELMLIGAGGIFSAEDALAKILAGATLVQLYTGFAYRGPRLIRDIKSGLAAALKARGFKSVSEAIGAGH